MALSINSIDISNEASSYITIKWEYGDVKNVLVIATSEDTIEPPEQSKSYVHNHMYGKVEYDTTYSYVVFNGTDKKFTLYDLKDTTTYNLFFYEYTLDVNGDPVYENYVTSTSITTKALMGENSFLIEVKDDYTKLPIKNAEVSVKDYLGSIVLEGTTDMQGHVTTYGLPYGRYKITAVSSAYSDQTIMSIYNKNMKDNKSSFRTITRHKYTLYMRDKVRDDLAGQDFTKDSPIY